MVRGRIAQRLKKWAFLTVGVIGLLLVTFGAAGAVFYPGIDTTDGTNSDWAGVGVFKTDPSGDAPNPDEDWINGWVSSTGSNTASDRIHFLMEVSGPGEQYREERAEAVFLDCNQDGIMEQLQDAVVAYDRWNDSHPTEPGWDDKVLVCDGEVQECRFTEGRDFGQFFTVSGDQDQHFVEWGVPLNLLPPNEISDPSANCQDGVIDIKFVTSDSTVGAPDVIDDADNGFRGYNIPTAINLNSFNAQNNSSSSSLPLLLAGGAMIVVGFGGFILTRRKKS